MPLCSLCSGIPFVDLPVVPKPWATSRVADNKDMAILRYKDSYESQDPIGLPWHENLDALALSASTCGICAVVQAGVELWLDRYRAAEKEHKSWVEFGKVHDPIPNGQRLWLTPRFEGGPGFYVLVRVPSSNSAVYLLTGVAFGVDAGNSLASQIPLRPMEWDSASEHNLHVVSSWLEQCIAEHDRCKDEETQLPSRVLDIGASDDIIKLVDGTGMTGKYACLSYCWGSCAHFTTSKESIEARRAGIALSELPKTFLDTVVIARHLKIRYLWIDSLCICQDDADDWARESSRMTHIYSSAHLVIAANRGSDNSAGCFHRREARHKSIVTLPTYGGSGASDVHAMLIFPSDEFTDGGTFAEEPLTSRGWALQERFLARRIVHYNSRQMYFECNHGIVSEDGSRMRNWHCDLSDIGASDTSSERPHGGSYEMWYSLVWQCGERKLTNPTDKLPAMSGLAKSFKKDIGAKYVAGLWSNALIEGIAWQGLGDRKPAATDEDMYLGPSWSWASYQGIAATGLRMGWQDLAKVEEWHVELKNEANPFHTDPVELMMSGIWDAFLRIFPEREGLTIFSECHGREPWAADIDPSRTVGWFTTLSPIHIQRKSKSMGPGANTGANLGVDIAKAGPTLHQAYGEVYDAWMRIHGPMSKLTPSEKTVVDHDARLKKVGITPLPWMRTKHSNTEEGAQVRLDHEKYLNTGEWREWDLHVMILGGYPKRNNSQKENNEDSKDDEDKKSGKGEEDESVGGDYWYGLVVMPVEHKAGANRMKRVGFVFLDGDETTKIKEDKEA